MRHEHPNDFPCSINMAVKKRKITEDDDSDYEYPYIFNQNEVSSDDSLFSSDELESSWLR